ncbi:MAG TPA: glycosyltransferase family 39 protein [Tepidisphaeraceae bacterium]|nr:glycosyltransferase family 39 protein [Tepidisphaeraceae bacterium]
MDARPREMEATRGGNRAACHGLAETVLHVLLIMAVIGAVYGQCVAADFVTWDDNRLILNNPHITQGGIDGLIWHWEHPHEQLYIPLVYSVWWFVAAIAGVKSAAFHLANLVVFSGSAILVYAILRMLVGRPWAALMGAMIFAVHPLQVEPVAWATGMKDLLCTFLSLAAILLYLRPRYYIAATACFLAALLCKPSAVMVPFVAAAIDLLVVGRRWKYVVWHLAPWTAAAAAMAIITPFLQPPVTMVSYPLWSRPLIACDALDWYMRKLIWPGAMTIDYGRAPQRVMTWHIMGVPWIALAWVIPVTMAVLLVYARRPVLSAAGLIFVLPLVPVSGLQPFYFQLYSTVADRYANLSLLGPALGVAWLLAVWNFRGRYWMICVVALMLAVNSAIEARYWRNDFALFGHAIAVNPDTTVGYSNLAAAYEKIGDKADAAMERRAWKEAFYHYPDAHNLLGTQYLNDALEALQSGNEGKARRSFDLAAREFAAELKTDRSNAEALEGMKDAQSGMQDLNGH